MNLPDNQLIDAFHKAQQNNLEEEFIQLLGEEMIRRGLEVKRIG